MLQEFITTYNVQIISAITSIIVTLLSLLVTYLLGISKLRYSEKVKIVGELSKKKFEGIKEIRSEITILQTYEDLGITEDEEDLIPENRGKKIYTPVCCYSYDNLSDFSSKLNDFHGKYGCYLRDSSVIYLVYIKNFLRDYMMACKRNGLTEKELRWVSVPLYNSFHKWFKIFDKNLIRSLNKPNMKYYAHSGVKYNLLLKLYGIYFSRSFPHKYLNDPNSYFGKMVELKNN